MHLVGFLFVYLGYAGSRRCYSSLIVAKAGYSSFAVLFLSVGRKQKRVRREGSAVSATSVVTFLRDVGIKRLGPAMVAIYLKTGRSDVILFTMKTLIFYWLRIFFEFVWLVHVSVFL